MGMVLKFPDKPGAAVRLSVIGGPVASQVTKVTPSPGVSNMGIPKALLSHLINAVWTLTLLLWPILRWIMALDVAFQGFRMAVTWSDPGTHAGITFIVHFLVFAAVTYFATNYKPKKD